MPGIQRPKTNEEIRQDTVKAKDIANRYGVCTGTVYYWSKTGKINAIKLENYASTAKKQVPRYVITTQEEEKFDNLARDPEMAHKLAKFVARLL